MNTYPINTNPQPIPVNGMTTVRNIGADVVFASTSSPLGTEYALDPNQAITVNGPNLWVRAAYTNSMVEATQGPGISTVTSAVGGSVATEPPLQVAMGGSPWTMVMDGSWTQTFAWPSGTYQAVSLYIGTGNDVAVENVTVQGVNTGAYYLQPVNLGPSSYIAFPANPSADPDGIIVNGKTNPPTGGNAYQMYAYAMSGTTVVRQVTDTGANGPNQYISGGLSGASGNVQLIAGSGKATTGRIWSAYLSGRLISGSCGIMVGVTSGPYLLYAYGDGTAYSVNINQSYPQGLQVPLYETSLSLITGSGFSGAITGGIAYSMDYA